MAQLAVENNVNKCECSEYFSNSIFDNKCSLCFYKSNPEDYYKITKYKPKKYHTDSYLYNHVFKNKVPSEHYLFKTLKQMFTEDKILENNNIFLWIEFLKINTNYKGISVKQGVELFTIFCNSNQNIDEKKKLKIQHIILGLIIDWWKLYKYKNIFGGATCYYDGDIITSNDIINSRLLEYGNKIKDPIGINYDKEAWWIKFINK